MEDLAVQVHVGILNRLRLEHIVSHERHLRAQLLRQRALVGRCNVWKVLHNQLEVWSYLGNSDAAVAGGAADLGTLAELFAVESETYIDDRAVTEASPVIVVGKMLGTVLLTGSHAHHEFLEALCHLRSLPQPRE